jgi:hypothetical protein
VSQLKPDIFDLKIYVVKSVLSVQVTLNNTVSSGEGFALFTFGLLHVGGVSVETE